MEIAGKPPAGNWLAGNTAAPGKPTGGVIGAPVAAAAGNPVPGTTVGAGAKESARGVSVAGYGVTG